MVANTSCKSKHTHTHTHESWHLVHDWTRIEIAALQWQQSTAKLLDALLLQNISSSPTPCNPCTVCLVHLTPNGPKTLCPSSTLNPTSPTSVVNPQDTSLKIQGLQTPKARESYTLHSMFLLPCKGPEPTSARTSQRSSEERRPRPSCRPSPFKEILVGFRASGFRLQCSRLKS